jgi:integrase
MDRRPPIRANREKAALSAVMTECVKWGAIDRNLVREVKRNKEVPRDRYVEDEELEAFKRYATPMLLAYVELRMLTGLRQGQILSLKRLDWDGSRLKAPRAKLGRTTVYRGDGLREAVEAVLSLNVDHSAVSIYLLSSRSGTKYSSSGFQSIWQRCMKRYVEATGAERFTENDLRAKVASDSADLATASARLGHQSTTTTNRVYRRRPDTVYVLVPGENSE